MNIYDGITMNDKVKQATPPHCPKCGTPLNTWDAIAEQWECACCEWKGRAPRPQPQEIPG